MTTVLDHPDLAGCKFLGDEDVCHVVNGRRHGSTICGAPYNCVPREAMSLWAGQEHCPDCARLVCPECRQRANRLDRLDGRPG